MGLVGGQGLPASRGLSFARPLDALATGWSSSRRMEDPGTRFSVTEGAWYGKIEGDGLLEGTEGTPCGKASDPPQPLPFFFTFFISFLYLCRGHATTRRLHPCIALERERPRNRHVDVMNSLRSSPFLPSFHPSSPPLSTPRTYTNQMSFRRSSSPSSSLSSSSRTTLLRKILSRRKSVPNDENVPFLPPSYHFLPPSYHSPPPSPSYLLPPYTTHWQVVEEPKSKKNNKRHNNPLKVAQLLEEDRQMSREMAAMGW